MIEFILELIEFNQNDQQWSTRLTVRSWVKFFSGSSLPLKLFWLHGN